MRFLARAGHALPHPLAWRLARGLPLARRWAERAARGRGSLVKVAVLAMGTRGAVQPYLALAMAFAREGHEVRLGGPGRVEFAQAAEQLGVPYTPLGTSVDSGNMAGAFTRAARARLPLEESWIFLHAATASVASNYEGSVELARWSDLVVVNFLQVAGRLAAERLGRPFVTGYTPWCELRTDFRPPGRLPNAGLVANRLAWTLIDWYANVRALGGLNRVRQEYGLRRVDTLSQALYSPHLNLVATSPRVIQPPPDWAPRHRVTGYWFLDRPDWTPPADLAAFMAREPRPVAIGFGSMVRGDAAATTRLVERAVALSGVRAVLQAGWAGLGEGSLPPTIFAAGDVPHDWLFPRSAAAVHHGGGGTSAAAFRAGVPSVMVPHIHEQERWAARALELGVAPPAVPHYQLTAERLAAAIAAASSQSMRARATELGEVIRREDGLATAVRLVTACAAGAASERAPVAAG